jgi:DNA-binding transcriptional ArsR family regulator
MQTMQALSALADPIRRQIVEMLAERERDAGELASAFPVSRPAVSRHLRVLRQAGLVQVRPEAQRRVYALDPRPLEDLARWLDRYRGFWSQRLDALGTELARGRRRRGEGR